MQAKDAHRAVLSGSEGSQTDQSLLLANATPLNKYFHHINALDDFLILLPLSKSRRWNHYGILRERNCGSRPESFALLISVRWLIGPSGQFLFPEQLHIRSVGARHDLPATLALDRGGAARRAEPKGRLDDLEVVKPQKAK